MLIKYFGIVAEITGLSEEKWDMTEIPVSQVKNRLREKYPKLSSIREYMVAVNQSYALEEDTVYEQDEVAIIPPVSGG